jgi:CDP-2,3-bis-(O-geranylgeranyl)-sn-glycerol synthase
MTIAILDIVFLLLVANGAPILADCACRHLLKHRADGGLRMPDGQPIFGESKTVRGIATAIAATSVAAVLIGYSAVTGALVGSLAMLGDLLSSFIKRRLRRPPTSKVIGLDQIPEALIPATVMASQFNLTAQGIATATGLFLVMGLGLSRMLYTLGIRKQPH